MLHNMCHAQSVLISYFLSLSSVNVTLISLPKSVNKRTIIQLRHRK